MDDLVNMVNVNWNSADPIYIASFVLWRLNHIHPFINGNGRTARAACYFILCARAGNWLPGDVILPELLKRNRDEYVAALRHADASIGVGELDLSMLHALIERLLLEQLQSSSNQPADPAAMPPTEPESAEQAAAVIRAVSADAAAVEAGEQPNASPPGSPESGSEATAGR
ncbi:Fic/DOC family protein [compost metagenome]